MDFIKNLLSFQWAKGYRTWAIVLVLVGSWVAEATFGYEVPYKEYAWRELLAAIGLATAAIHDKA